MAPALLFQLTNTFNLSSDEATNVIKNGDTLIKLVLVIIPALIAAVKALLSFFTPQKELPQSLYFTQSFETRAKKTKNSNRTGKLIIALSSIVFVFYLYSFDTIIGHDTVEKILTILSFITLIIMFAALFFCIFISFSKYQYHINNSTRLYYGGRIFFVSGLISLLSYTYSFAYDILSIFFEALRKMETEFNKLDDAQKEALTNVFYRERLNITLLAIFAIILFALGYYILVVLLYYTGVTPYKKDEYIALGYTRFRKRPRFIHYLEGDYYVISGYAYYDEHGTVQLLKKDDLAAKNIYINLIDPSLKYQITDLYNYKNAIRSAMPVDKDISALIHEGQYRKLNKYEKATLNKWVDKYLKSKRNNKSNTSGKKAKAA